MSDEILIDKIIKKLLSVRTLANKVVNLEESELTFLINKVTTMFSEQNMLLEIKAPVKICGDIHGQYADLLSIFEFGHYPPESNYLFLGDYVDRGKQSIECIALLFAYKLKYKDNFFLLRGNHECSSVNRIYGFYDECKRRHSVKLWKLFSEAFNVMPVAALVGEKILCMHGGISPDLKSLTQINSIARPTDIPDQGLLCDLLWSDPHKEAIGFEQNKDRGVSYVFGVDELKMFLVSRNLDLVVRAHQVAEDGYEFFGDKDLVTVFSAPNYCGEYGNSAAIMNVDSNLLCSFQILKPSFGNGMSFDTYNK